MRELIITALLVACSHFAMADDVLIRLNQVGYAPNQEKMVIVETQKAQKYSVTDAAGNTVLKGKTTEVAQSPFSKKKGWRIDLSGISKPGAYTIALDATSAQFKICDNPLRELSKAAIKAFYYQRTGMPIEGRFAGKWSRPVGHKDTEVLIHPSAATPQRPAGSVISSPKGWYDAGDFNKYIVNSGFTIGQILSIYPLCENLFKGLDLNIPESGNGIPDVLDEMMYNLDWMLTMQDPNDGGVYHKLTTPYFEGFIMPTECKQKRYVVQKSTCAALDFAACMAMASRIYRPYDSQLGGFCERALDAAKLAYEWAKANPREFYRQEQFSKTMEPPISTGGYGDFNPADEFFWAATELWLTTQDEQYKEAMLERMPAHFSVPTWGNVAGLGLTSLLVDGRNKALKEAAIEKLVAWCDARIKDSDKQMYYSPFGNVREDFHWASISEGAGTEGSLMMLAYIATKNDIYKVNAQRNMDYILGRNATGYCFVTGFGTKSPMHPHHRLSAADGIDEPIPGLLVGGPNATPTDGCSYPSDVPDELYIDNQDSYTTNEIAINWNAALVVITALLQ